MAAIFINMCISESETIVLNFTFLLDISNGLLDFVLLEIFI